MKSNTSSRLALYVIVSLITLNRHRINHTIRMWRRDYNGNPRTGILHLCTWGDVTLRVQGGERDELQLLVDNWVILNDHLSNGEVAISSRGLKRFNKKYEAVVEQFSAGLCPYFYDFEDLVLDINPNHPKHSLWDRINSNTQDMVCSDNFFLVRAVGYSRGLFSNNIMMEYLEVSLDTDAVVGDQIGLDFYLSSFTGFGAPDREYYINLTYPAAAEHVIKTDETNLAIKLMSNITNMTHRKVIEFWNNKPEVKKAA